LPYVAPTGPATTGVLNADDSPEATAIDIQGVLGILGSGDEITLTLALNNTTGAPVDYGALSQTVSVPSNLIEGGGGPIDVTLSYAAGTAPVDASNLTVTIAAATPLNAKKLDLNAGIGNDNLGVLLADFSLGSEGGSTGVQVRISGGILDREFGNSQHRFMYLPVTSATGRVWLNNNLGADYANINHASFDLSQQAKVSNDSRAYGSLYQWGRYSDGHEFRTSTATSGSLSDWLPNESENDFRINNIDWLSTRKDDLWSGTAAINNPCPAGFRLPTNVEFEQERIALNITNAASAASSVLKLTVGGRRFENSGTISNVGDAGLYWTGSAATSNSYQFSFGSSSASSGGSSYRAKGHAVRCIQD
jgi:uncharacterized protein (TIGR02145 family)